MLLGLVLFIIVPVSGCNTNGNNDNGHTQSFLEHFQKANDYLLQGEWDDAITEYSNTILFNPGLTDAYASRAIAYYQQQFEDDWYLNDEKIIADCEKALELTPSIQLDPKIAVIYVRQGDWLLDERDYYEAIEYYERAKEINPIIECLTEGEVYAIAGDDYLESESYDRALTFYYQALVASRWSIDVSWGQSQCYFHKGLGYFESFEYELGISYITVAIELYPNSGEYFYERGSAYFGWADSLLDLQYEYEEVEGIDNYSEFLGNLADANYYQASLDADEAIALGYEKSGVYRLRGLCRWINGDHLGAVQDFSIYIDTSPSASNLWSVYWHRGMIYGYHLQEKEKALADLEMAMSLIEDDFIKGLILEDIEEISNIP